MENSKGTDTKKTQVFNVIILDRSGSMGCIRRAAVDGFNETLSGIKKSARELRRHAGPLRDARDILQLRNATGVR